MNAHSCVFACAGSSSLWILHFTIFFVKLGKKNKTVKCQFFFTTAEQPETKQAISVKIYIRISSSSLASPGAATISESQESQHFSVFVSHALLDRSQKSTPEK